nr:UDP-N-acetylglucosamine 2-epimerase [Thiomicrorhabdus sp. 6S3-12]
MNLKRAHFGIVTTSRADYGLLKPLWSELQETEFKTTMIATGSHLMEAHGKTLSTIKADDVTPLESVDLMLAGDSEMDVCRAVAVGIEKFSELYSSLKFDLLIVLGDRYELIAACNAALIHKIPIAHLHGGEATFGALDEAIRHSVTKMATLHFVSHEVYRRRVIQMGESPDRVWNVGAIGLDNFRQVNGWTQNELEQKTGLDFSQPVLLVTFHPVTLDSYQDAEAQADELVSALENLPYQVLATLPNADAGSQQIIQRLQVAHKLHPQRFTVVSSLGMEGYISAMRYSSAMVGNSSSGILEAASFRLPVVNIGDRQAGRIQPGNVIQVECQFEQIKEAVAKALSKDFKASISSLVNPYGEGETAKKIVARLSEVSFEDKQVLLKKSFLDFPADCFLKMDLS